MNPPRSKATAKKSSGKKQHAYALLFRGINVGGKNKMPMAALKQVLEELGFSRVTTYIQSGNAVVLSPLDAKAVASVIEKRLPKKFSLDSALIRTLVLTTKQFRDVIKHKPKGFGDEPQKYHSDTIFLIDIEPKEALTVFKPREGVDAVWPGKGVIYSRRLSAKRTQSRLGKIVGTKPYQSMTIRNWNTTVKMLELLNAAEESLA